MKFCIIVFLAISSSLMVIPSASAGFVATSNATVLALVGDYSGGSGKLLNRFDENGQLVTTPATSFATDIYTQPLPLFTPEVLYNAYLVLPYLPGAFGLEATLGEKIIGVAASNGRGGLTNIFGSHSELQNVVKSALIASRPLIPNSTLNDAILQAFTAGNSAVEITGLTNAPDSMLLSSDFKVLTGSVNFTNFNGSLGLNEMFLVFTVPEPASGCLFVLGGVAFGIARSRRNAKLKGVRPL